MTKPAIWPTHRFDQIAENITDRVEPAEADTDIYVGLEHLDPDSLKIRRWGKPSDVIGTKFCFQPGDIIFGRRRAYQRKLAVAEVEGICSAHAMVLRAREDVVLPEFLPFFLQSDTFFGRAMAISVGSLSPTINWKTLAQQEFALPPLDEQRRIAEILWAADEAIEKHADVLNQLNEAKSKFLEEQIQQRWKSVSLGNVLFDTQYGTSKRSGFQKDGCVPVLRIPNVVKMELDLSDLQWIELTEGDLQRYTIAKGDVLVVRTNGNPSYVGRSVAISSLATRMAFASYLIRLRPDETRVRSKYLEAVLNSSYLRKTLRHEIRSSAGHYNLNTKGIGRQKIPLPPLNKQDEIIQQLNQFDSTVAHCQEHIENLRTVKSVLLNKLMLQGADTKFVGMCSN